MRKDRLVVVVACLLSVVPLSAQHAVVEESAIDITCESATHAITHFRQSVTILDEHAASLGTFSCSCSSTSKLGSFKGTVTDASGRVLRKLKESELQRTEYSPYLAIDEHILYLEYTPPVYPVTVTYEWTIDSRNDLIEFPRFCPQSDYDIGVKKASYRLKAPKSMTVRHALQNISESVTVSDDGKYSQIITLELSDLPPLKQEPYTRPLRERMPIAYFAPEEFTYFGTQGNLRDWTTYGQWEYGLICGSESLPDAVCQEIHQLTDGLPASREKVAALYERLAKTTRYVAILLGIGGQRPASAASVCKSGFGDCKGLSNYMRAMLKEVGIPSNYTTISTTNRRLLADFASAGQMNHVILQVPLPGDTLWLECTNPQLPMGYVHEDIAGHDAIEVSERGGRLVRLPVYADSANLQRSTVHLALEANGTADITFSQTSTNRQYESMIPLLNMDDQDRHKALQRIMHVPQAEIGQVSVSEEGASITLDAAVRSRQYANVTGQRLFVPVSPIHHGYSVPRLSVDRQEDIWIDLGYQDEDDITIAIPDGYEIEARPKDVLLVEPFGTFVSTLSVDGGTIRIKNLLLRHSGTFDKALYPRLADFMKAVSAAYGQKIVLKKK